MKRIFLFCCGLMLCTFIGAQTNYGQRQLTMDNGLMSNAVRSIVQDQRGFIWMGTENGLSRYDGIEICNYPIPNIEAEQTITSVVCQKDGDLLIGTNQGVFRFSYTNEQFTLLPIKLTKAVTHLSLDADNNLWIATAGQGVVRYSLEKESEDVVEFYPLRDIGGKVDVVYTDANNQQWITTHSGKPELWRLNKSKNVFEPVGVESVFPHGATSMLQTNDGTLWLGTWDHGLMRVHDNGTLEQMPVVASGHYQHIRTLYEMSNRHLLLGCDDGLWSFDPVQRTYELYLPLRFVTTITSDHEGGLWIGAMYGGATYLSPIAYRFDSTPVGQTTRFCEDRVGRIWTTCEGGGLACYKNDIRQQFNGQAKLKDIKGHALCLDGDDLWIGTYSDGIYVFSTVTSHLRHYDVTNDEHSLYDPNSCTLLHDNKGNIWVATMEGLCLYDRKNDRFNRMAKVQSVPIDIKEDHSGRLWIATQGSGVWTYQQDTKKVKTYQRDNANENSLSANIVNCVYVDGRGHVWAGTQGGLCLFDDELDNFRRIRLDMPRLAIAAITEDQGSLWISGDCGILKYTPEKGMQRFTRHDGLESEQFHPNAVLKAHDGRVYFGTTSGFNAFYPHKIKVNQMSAPVFITQLEINNEPVSVGTWHLPNALSETKKLDLWNNDKVFSLSFASLSYCSPEKNIYAYMLEGFDKKWNYVGHEHKATYTNLPAGTYTFRVKATNNDGVWSEQEAQIVIQVHPPFWWNIYAKVFYVIMFIVLVYLFIRTRLWIAERRHRKEIQLLNEKKQEELRNARIEFFTTIAHEIRTPVSLIIGPLDKLKEELKKEGRSGSSLDIIDRNAHRLLELVNQLLDFRKVEQSNMEMNFTPQCIKDLMRTVVENFEPVFKQHGNEFKVTYPDHGFTAVVDREGFVKVLSNLLSNANKYTHSKIMLSAVVLHEKKQFRIDVTDDGNGIDNEDLQHVFDPFFQAKNSKPGSGIGLSIVKKIVEQHHGSVKVKSKLGYGTTFTVMLPISQEYSGEQYGKQEETSLALPVEEKPVMLIVDDNEDMLTFLVTTFMDKYEVISAHDGNEAIKIIEESLVVKDGQAPTSTINIIISDWMMAEMDGPELCNRLRQNAATCHIPFILLTAKTDSQSKVEAMRSGVDAFIEKPFAVKYLEACIDNLLNRQIRQKKN